MPKQIVFCSDGTWNGPPDAASTNDIDGTTQKDAELHDDVTNVFKLFASLRGEVTSETQALSNETEMVLAGDGARYRSRSTCTASATRRTRS